ncbi:MAG: hypothetical protein LC775_19965, partial [Acidobacteria bacterium]|nr:hypothetical protein [Acidobacteriota bacterium]
MTELKNMLTIIGAITSQVVLTTAVFYYFGWVYNRSYFAYFGIHNSLFEYGTADYVLRSIDVTFRSFIYLIFAALVSFAFHRLMMVPALSKTTSDLPLAQNTAISGAINPATSPRFTRPGLGRAVGLVVGWARALGHWRLGPSGIRRIIGLFQVVALVLAGAVFAGLIFPAQFGASLGLFLPLSLMLSANLLAYAAYVRSMYPDVFAAAIPPWRTTPSRTYYAILLTLGLMAGLWAVSVYGDHVGTRVATKAAAQLPNRSGVIVY